MDMNTEIGGVPTTRLEALERFAQVCAAQQRDEWTDFEEVVENHRRLARIALAFPDAAN